MHFSDVTQPTVIVNETVVRRNIMRMALRAEEAGAVFRPHFKTHQSAGIAAWCRDAGVERITVSSVAMARYFADHGWGDILIAFPVNSWEIAAINALASEIALGVLVESPESAAFLAANLSSPVNVWLEIDTGYHRTGIPWDMEGRLVQTALAVLANDTLSLMGLLVHAGHSYGLRSEAAINAVNTETTTRLQHAKRLLANAGIAPLRLSSGDTPCCSIASDLSGIDEIRPGVFVFYDLVQQQIGACRYEDIGMAVLCPVVARYPAQNKIVIYGGAVHLSKDRLTLDDGREVFGQIALPDGDGWGSPVPGAFVTGLSQEHGTIHVDKGFINKVKIGDGVFVLPVHACLTANLLKRYRTLTGEWITMMGA